MASGQDNNDSETAESNASADVIELPILSAKAQAIKRQIQEGTYRINLPGLAETLLEEVELPTRPSATQLPTPQNDQEPRDD